MQNGLGGGLLGINKEAYYYQQQLAEYKSMINDKEKLEETLLAAVRQVPSFQSFWQKYSMLAQLFPKPSSLGSIQGLSGLQTKSDMESIVKQAGGGVGPDPQYIGQQVEQAQSTLNGLKDKISALGGTGGSGDMTMPDFTPNPQHGKSILKRLEIGFNIQNSAVTGILPSTSNVALTIGYKISNKATVGLGASYIVGWGHPFKDISLSNQGESVRTFVEIKAKGSIWLTGGFEYTHYQALAEQNNFYNVNAWQKSALIGLTKKTTIGRKAQISRYYIIYCIIRECLWHSRLCFG